MVDRLQHEYGSRIELEWKAFELRPEPVPLPPVDGPDRRRRWVASVLPMAEARGLIMKQPPIMARTRLAFQAVELARDRDRVDAMHLAIFEAFFRDGRDIGRIDVLAGIADAIDLPPDALKTALASGIHLARVIEQERQAADLGVTGVPAMLVGDDPATAEPVIGAVPYDWLQAAVERALSGESLEWRKRALKSGIPIKERGD